MRIKLDENLPLSLAPMLNGLGHDADTVRDKDIEGAVDDIV